MASRRSTSKRVRRWRSSGARSRSALVIMAWRIHGRVPVQASSYGEKMRLDDLEGDLNAAENERAEITARVEANTEAIKSMQRDQMAAANLKHQQEVQP